MSPPLDAGPSDFPIMYPGGECFAPLVPGGKCFAPLGALPLAEGEGVRSTLLT